MNDKLIQRAVECYTEKLEEENKTLRAFIVQITDAFSYNGGKKERDDKEILKNIRNTLRVYANVFKEGTL